MKLLEEQKFISSKKKVDSVVKVTPKSKNKKNNKSTKKVENEKVRFKKILCEDEKAQTVKKESKKEEEKDDDDEEGKDDKEDEDENEKKKEDKNSFESPSILKKRIMKHMRNKLNIEKTMKLLSHFKQKRDSSDFSGSSKKVSSSSDSSSSSSFSSSSPSPSYSSSPSPSSSSSSPSSSFSSSSSSSFSSTSSSSSFANLSPKADTNHFFNKIHGKNCKKEKITRETRTTPQTVVYSFFKFSNFTI